MFISTIIFPFGGLKISCKLSESGIRKLIDINRCVFIAIYIGYIISLFFYSLRFLLEWNLNCACSFIITCENVSLICNLKKKF